ncbi:helix-turn-helix transcriptional regulator [Rhizobium populisoli]|uniref:helix-turn-helix transcriptional regulator n=1 Tax=Rhizobium populisoli TaxID=2859785 RepID=UPI0028ABE1B3|nr:LuxR family transcriptional regulator [Rhizobium populisoli]
MATELDDIIATIYEASVFPERWPAVISAICKTGDFFIGATTASSGALGTWMLTPNAGILFDDFVAGGWAERNERLERAVKKGQYSFVQDFDLFSENEWQELPIYRDFLVPRGFGYGTATVIPTPGARQMVVIFERRLEQGRIGPQSIDMLNRLRPHLARGMLLSAEMERQSAQKMLIGLSAIGAPAAVVAADRRVIAANGDFEELNQITFLSRDMLALKDPKAHSQLVEGLKLFSGDAVQSIPLPGGDDRDACVLHIVPLQKDARDLAPSAAAIVVVSKPTETPDGVFPILRGLYDLTRGEARVASEMLSGHALPVVAENLNLSHETVRSVAKSIYAKTASAGHADLIRRLSVVTRYSPQGN